MIVIYKETTGQPVLHTTLPSEETISLLGLALCETIAQSIPGKDRAAFVFGELCGEMCKQIQDMIEEKEREA